MQLSQLTLGSLNTFISRRANFENGRMRTRTSKTRFHRGRLGEVTGIRRVECLQF